MVLVLPKMFEFAAPPRTGVHWFVKVCTEAGLETFPSIYLVPTSFIPWSGHGQIKKDVFRVSMVRHPCDWLRSMFDAWQNSSQNIFFQTHMRLCRFRFHESSWIGDGDNQNHFPYREFASSPGSHFDEFVVRYLKRNAGEIGRIFDSYKTDTRLRLEDMPWALIELLESLGVEQDKLDRIVDLAPQSKAETRSRWQSDLRQQVLESETEFCQNLDYY